MALNSEINRLELISHFSNLADDPNFIITSERTNVYNCIAWAMGMTDWWVDHNITISGHWWPETAICTNSKDALISAFEALGFVLADSPMLEDGYDKVVLYGRGTSWTHAARIVADGVEHSKFGTGWDGTHSSKMFHHTIYGDAYAFMKREISKRYLTEKCKPQRGKCKILKKPVW